MKCITVIMSIVLAIAIVGIAYQITQAQRPQGGPGGFGGGRAPAARAMQAVGNTWAGIAFEVKVDNETLEKARTHLQQAWDARKKLMKDSAGDMRIIAQGMVKINESLDEKLKTVLTEEQMKKLSEWEDSQQQAGMGGGRRGEGI
ncbi:hypothetical protein H8E77_08255 [bacterium]|nr:hypothetical protein [bacterium]